MKKRPASIVQTTESAKQISAGNPDGVEGSAELTDAELSKVSGGNHIAQIKYEDVSVAKPAGKHIAQIKYED